jgi:hypothetical protein
VIYDRAHGRTQASRDEHRNEHEYAEIDECPDQGVGLQEREDIVLPDLQIIHAWTV